MFPHLLAAILILPGALLVNYMGQRFFPSRSWAGDPRRPRVAGWLSVPLIWGLPLLSAAFEIGPGHFLSTRLDSIGAWIVHVCGLMIVGSTLSLAIAWALPPKPPVTIRRLSNVTGDRG